MIGQQARSTLHPFVNEMSSGHATSYFFRLSPSTRLQDLPFHHVLGQTKVYTSCKLEKKDNSFLISYSG